MNDSRLTETPFFSASSSAFTPLTPGPHAPAASDAAAGAMGAAVLAIADIERQLERLITQRKAEREAVAGHTVAENGKGQKAKPGGGGHDERTDGSSIGSKATQNKRYNLNEELLAGVLGIPLITNEIARGGRSRPESPPTTSAPSLIPISIPMPTPTSTPSTTQRPTTPTNAVECVLQGASSNDNAVTAASIQEPASPLNNSSMTAAATASFEPSQSVVAAALRREIMGEVKAELLMEVSRRDKENQGKLYDLELENRELKQELHGLLREMREDRRRKERERAERKKRGQRRSQQKRDSNSGSSDVESSDDEMRSDPEADEEEEPRRKGLKRRRRSDIGVPNSKRKREDDATPATLGGKEAVAAEEDQRGAQPETTAEQAEPVLPHEKKPSTEQLAGVPQVSPHGVDRSLSTSDSDEAIAPTRGGRRKPSRSTVWRRKKGRRAAEEIEHDNEERWQMRVEELRAFIKEHGHCRVPKSYPNRPLYTWTQNVRQRWRRGAVPERKVKDLVALGMHNPAEDYLNQHAEKGKDHSSATTRSTDEPEEDAVESRKDEAEDEGTKVNKRRGAGGRPRAVKRSRRGKRTQASSTTKGEGHGQSDDEDEQEQELQRSQLVRESDDDYTEKDDDDEDEMEEEEVDMEEEETQKQTKRRRGEGGGAGKMRNVAEGVVTRKRAKSLTLAEDKKEANERRENSPNGRKRKSMVLPTVAGHEKGKKNKLDASKRNEAEERREHGRVKSDRGGVEERKKKSKKASKIEPSEDDNDREEEIQGSDDDEEDQDGDAGEDEDGDEIPKNHVNQKWFERLEDVKGWQKRTNLNRPNRKQDATLGRWADEQLNRARSGTLLPWRRKLLDAIGFFANDP